MLTRSFSARLRAVTLTALALLAGCAPKLAAHDATETVPSHAGVSYEVRLRDGGQLDVAVRLARGVHTLALDDGMPTFMSGLTTDGGLPLKAPWNGATLDLSKAPACADGCTLRYRFDLSRAAEVAGDADSAEKIADMYISCPTAWLVRPAEAAEDAPFELTVSTDPHLDFAFGDPAEKGVYRGALGDLAEAPYAALGSFRRMHLDEAPLLDIVVAGPEPTLGDAALLHWVREAVLNLRTFYDGYPVHHALLIVHVEPGGRIGGATTMGNGGASIEVRFGADTTPQQVANDWILTHEMFHVAFPGLSREHHWAEEGMATYLEPIARARRGVIPVSDVWREWVQSMPQGQPASEDQGLDQTPTWGRTYWGGAVFWFQSDVGARRATAGQKGAPDLFAAVYRQADVAVRWPMTKLVHVADEATASDVISKLYDTHAEHAVKVDLDGMFHDLGVAIDKGDVVFDDAAPLAAIRKAMVTGPAQH